MIMQLVMDDNDTRTSTLESFHWLQNTYQRDFIDQLVYQTVRVYTMNFRGYKFNAVDRLHIDKSGRKSDQGDTKRIHAREVEDYTLTTTSG